MRDRGIPVDKGWAWVVMLCGLAIHILVGGAVYSVSVLNVLFIEAFQDSRANTAWIGALTNTMLSCTGIFSSLLVSWFNFRWTVVIGGILVATGCFLSAFASTLVHMMLTYGLITGVGFGMVVTPTCAVIGFYFKKFLIIAAAVASLGAGIGALVMAPLIQKLADKLGWRSAMLILGAMELHLCIFGALIRPVKRLPPSGIPGSYQQRSPIINTGIFHQYFILLKNKRYLSLCLSQFLISTGHWIFYIHISAFAITCGSSQENASFLMSIVGFLSMTARLLMPFAATDKNIDTLLIVAGSLGLNGVFLLLTPLLMPYDWGQMLLAALFGFYGNGYVPLLTAITVEVVGLDMLTAAYGGWSLMYGIGALVSPPLAGWLYDMTLSYQYSFLLSGMLILLSSVCLLTIPMFPLSATTKWGMHKIPPQDEVLVQR